MPLHEACRRGEGREPEPFVESVGIAGDEQQTTQPLHLGVPEKRGQQLPRHPLPPIVGEDVDVGEIGEGGPVGDEAGEADLRAVVEGGHAQRMRDGAAQHVERDVLRPVRSAQEPMGGLDIDARRIEGDVQHGPEGGGGEARERRRTESLHANLAGYRSRRPGNCHLNALGRVSQRTYLPCAASLS